MLNDPGGQHLLDTVADADVLQIGLVNIMPPQAMAATAQQFASLAIHSESVMIRHFNFSKAVQLADVGGLLAALLEAQCDGLIVTGTAPVANLMTNEPCWPLLATLVDWAGQHTISTLWSCFAAHAAVLQLDGINRQPQPVKLSGIYLCEKADPHVLTASLPSVWPTPHSRYNSLSEQVLVDNGYTILSRGEKIGVDSFTRHCSSSCFVFYQGHPEYSADSLASEYRRDVRQFLTGQSETYPEIPQNYFDLETMTALQDLALVAIRQRDPSLLTPVSEVMNTPVNAAWQVPSRSMFREWVCYIQQEKLRRSVRTA